jgi:hypothetical protein
MAEKPGPKPMEIDANEVYKLAQIGSTNKELAEWFQCSTDTIERRFAAELHKGRANLKMSLRRWQLEAAKKGNVAMMIWLGKQMLGQSEKVDQIVTSKTSINIEDKEVLKAEIKRLATLDGS